MMRNDMEHIHVQQDQQNRNRNLCTWGLNGTTLSGFVAQGAESGCDVIADPSGSGQVGQNYGRKPIYACQHLRLIDFSVVF
jgi:hypothetical protein